MISYSWKLSPLLFISSKTWIFVVILENSCTEKYENIYRLLHDIFSCHWQIGSWASTSKNIIYLSLGVQYFSYQALIYLSVAGGQNNLNKVFRVWLIVIFSNRNLVVVVPNKVFCWPLSGRWWKAGSYKVCRQRKLGSSLPTPISDLRQTWSSLCRSKRWRSSRRPRTSNRGESRFWSAMSTSRKQPASKGTS